jgi:futalosine hydrolase
LIGLISSVPQEGRLILGRIRRDKSTGKEPPGLPFFVSGKLFGKDVIYTISGMGKANAAHSATVLLERYSPSVVILFGVGGAYPSSGIGIGDVAIAVKEVYGDEGVLTPDGFRGTDFIGIPLLKIGRKRYFNEFPLFPPRMPLVSGKNFEIRYGIFITVSASTGTRNRADALEKMFGAVCENMEGAAVAQVCTMYNIPLIEVRGISNIVEDRDKGKWNLIVASEHCQKVVMELLKGSAFLHGQNLLGSGDLQ